MCNTNKHGQKSAQKCCSGTKEYPDNWGIKQIKMEIDIYIYMNESERQQLWEWYVSEYFLTLLKKILLAEKVLITS